MLKKSLKKSFSSSLASTFISLIPMSSKRNKSKNDNETPITQAESADYEIEEEIPLDIALLGRQRSSELTLDSNEF